MMAIAAHASYPFASTSSGYSNRTGNSVYVTIRYTSKVEATFQEILAKKDEKIGPVLEEPH